MKKFEFRYDYTKNMMLKLFLAEPDGNGGTKVVADFDDALEIIKKVDKLTFNVPKIIYLVGWQYLGHDDKYPDFTEVNAALKGKGENSAHESLLSFVEKAKAYNTVISLHINFNDAYDNAPSFEDYVKNSALIRKKNGKPHAIENYNGRKCYKVSFKEEWESGLFQKRFDRLCEILPLEELGTVHVDNFQCYQNYSPAVSIKEMQAYRKKMLEYARAKNIDITSEFTYREHDNLPNRPIFGLPREHDPRSPMDTLGLIPASWWCTKMTRHEYAEIPPALYSGVYKDFPYSKFLYGGMHGEPEMKGYRDGNAWEKDFLKEFALKQLPHFFLCNYNRKEIKGHFRNIRCEFNGGVVSAYRDQKITLNGKTVKERGDVFLPIPNRPGDYFVYSEKGGTRIWDLPYKNATKALSVTLNAGEGKIISF